MKSSDVDLFAGVVPFVTTAELRSFRAAARSLGLTPSAVSKAITRLEAKLGVRLLNRTSRSVSLTDEGQAFLAACQEAVSGVRAAEERVAVAARSTRGRLSLSLPLILGKVVILPALKRLSDRHPALVVDASLTDRFVSLTEENLEAVVRVGAVENERLVMRRLRSVAWVTVERRPARVGFCIEAWPTLERDRADSRQSSG
jgi:DNA-binding transcriptional LysR family regulator